MGQEELGLDLGLKTIVACSDGQAYTRENLTQQYEQKLAKAQRARKKKQVRNLHANIANSRRDWTQKVTTDLVGRCRCIALGQLQVKALLKTKMAKSISDACWGSLSKTLVEKAMAHGVEVKEVPEAYSTQTCHVCKERTGPKGREELGVRVWTCRSCGSEHDRDVNAAINLFVFGFGRMPLNTPNQGAKQVSLLGGPDAGPFAQGQESSDSGDFEKKVGTAQAHRFGHETPF